MKSIKLIALFIVISSVTRGQGQWPYSFKFKDGAWKLAQVNAPGDTTFYDLPADAVIPFPLANFDWDTAKQAIRNQISNLIANNSTQAGRNLLNVSTPATPSLPRLNANGTVSVRNQSEVLQDLALDQVNNTSDLAKPLSTASINALALKQDIATNNGGWATPLKVTGSNATTTGQVLVDITGLVTPTLLNATKYEVEIILDVGTSAVTTGTQYAIQTGGTGGAGVVSAIIVGTTTTNAASQFTLSAPATAAGTFLTTSGTNGTITIKGWVTTRGTGTATISVQHSKTTSGTSTVRVGSSLKYKLAQ